jgi:hypothetical protein
MTMGHNTKVANRMQAVINNRERLGRLADDLRLTRTEATAEHERVTKLAEAVANLADVVERLDREHHRTRDNVEWMMLPWYRRAWYWLRSRFDRGTYVAVEVDDGQA